MTKITFAQWLNRKYVDWRGDAVGRDRSLTEFARYIGVSQQLLSDWMSDSGKVPKHKEKIDKLVTVFGPEVYQVLGLADNQRARTMEKYLELDPQDQERIDRIVGEFWDEKAQHL